MGVACLIITEDGFSVFYRRWGYYHLYHVSTRASNSSSVRQPSPFSASSVAFKARCTASSTVYWHGIGVAFSFHPILRESSRSIAKSVLGNESVTFSMLVVVIVFLLSLLCLSKPSLAAPRRDAAGDGGEAGLLSLLFLCLTVI